MNLKRRQLAGLAYSKTRTQLLDVISVEGQRGCPTGKPVTEVSEAMAWLRKRMAKRGFVIKWENHGAGCVKMLVQGRMNKYIYRGCWHDDRPAGLVLKELR